MADNETKRLTESCVICNTELKMLRTAQACLALAYCPKCRECQFYVVVGEDYKFYDGQSENDVSRGLSE